MAWRMYSLFYGFMRRKYRILALALAAYLAMC